MGKESSKPKTLSLKTKFSYCLLDQSKNRLDRSKDRLERSNPKEIEFLKNLENFFVETFEKQFL